MPQSSSPFVGPTVGGGPYALASSGLRSTENRVHGGTPSLLPPLIVVAGAAPLPPGLPNPPPRRSPPASSAPLRGSPAAAAFAGDVCYESRGRLRDGRCAVLGSLRLRRAAPRGRAWDWKFLHIFIPLLVLRLLLSDWES